MFCLLIADFDYWTMVMKTTLFKNRFWDDSVSHWARILYHIGLAALSAAIALSLPSILDFIAKKVLIYWSILGNEKLIVVSIEMAVAILLILFFNILARNWKDRRLSNMAKSAGLVLVKPAKGFFARRRIKKMKEMQGYAKDVMVIGSTGLRTFVDPRGDLHQVLQNCRNAKIMLLNPFSEGARVRAKSIQDPHVTSETFGEQIKKSIGFLKDLKAIKKEVKLKLYCDVPLLKLAILDDYIWIQHYHAGLDVQRMPEYVFKHDQNLSSLYIPFYQYFMTRWNDPHVPEYDLESNELIHRDSDGNEMKRGAFTDSRPFWRNGNSMETGLSPLRQHRRHLCRIEEDFKNVW